MTMIPPSNKAGRGGSRDETCKTCGKLLHLHSWRQQQECEKRWAKEDR